MNQIEGVAKKLDIDHKTLYRWFLWLYKCILLTRKVDYMIFYYYKRLSSPLSLAELILSHKFLNILTYTRVQKSTYS